MYFWLKNIELNKKYVISAFGHEFPVFRHTLLKNWGACANLPGEEVIAMKNGKILVAKIAKQAAEKALRRDANQTTCVVLYQPKMPAGLNRFKKGNV